MITMLSFFDKLYSDTDTLRMVYIVGAILLFIFIILLIVSIRKPDKKKSKIIEEPKFDEDKKTEVKEHKEEETKTVDESATKESEVKDETESKIEEEKEEISSLNKALDTALKIEKNDETPKEEKQEETKKEEKVDKVTELSSEIPDVDDFVDNVVKKTYEKNEQFSSVYVGDNTSTIKLDKVLDNMNVDDNIKEDIVPEEEKTKEPVKNISLDNLEENLNKVEEPAKEEIEMPSIIKNDGDESHQEEKVNENKLEDLKASLNKKREETEKKEEDLKSKLDALKQENKKDEVMKPEDLLNKLNSLKK